MIDIQYTTHIEELLKIPELHPQPASLHVPDWYKKTPATNNNNPNILGKEQRKLLPIYKTVKTCPSFHDVFSEGIVLTAPCDIHIWLSKDNKVTKWLMAIDSEWINLEVHDELQWLNYYNNKKIRKVFKFSSPWYFRLPKGYSFRQIPYTYSEHNEWTVPYGVVNTDVYSELNPQILYTSEEDEILIKAGEPLCYLVPYKREKSKLKLLNKGKSRDNLLDEHQREGYIVNMSNRTGYFKL